MVLSLASGSFLLYLYWSVLSWICKRVLLKTFRIFPMHSSLFWHSALESSLPVILALSPQLRETTKLYLDSFFMCVSQNLLPGSKLVTVGLTSLVLYFSGISVLCCLTSYILRTIVSYILSSLWLFQEGWYILSLLLYLGQKQKPSVKCDQNQVLFKTKVWGLKYSKMPSTNVVSASSVYITDWG